MAADASFCDFDCSRCKASGQLEDNLAVLDVKLTDEDIHRLDEVSKLPPEYPGWMLQVQSNGRMGAKEAEVWDQFSN
jgi:hypothetical protein